MSTIGAGDSGQAARSLVVCLVIGDGGLARGSGRSWGSESDGCGAEDGSKREELHYDYRKKRGRKNAKEIACLSLLE